MTLGDGGADFPARYARTRRFSNGVPRAFHIAEDDSAVLFLRSDGPEDPVQSLWRLDLATGTEARLCDPRELGGDLTDLPPEERARRERARESGGGVVAYSATPDGTKICFALSGKLFLLDAGTAEVREVPVAGPVVDPRIAGTGERIAFVRDRALWLTDAAGNESLLAGDDAADVSWGLAEHAAAEEMDRLRGHWWAPGADRVLAARVDESMVGTWYIADPGEPAAAPNALRYPQAGTANADVTLALLACDGAPAVPVDWNRADFPYLAAVSYATDSPLILVQSRDQRTVQVHSIDPRTGATTVLREDTDERWVELVPGTPALTPDGRLVTVTAALGNDSYSLEFDGEQATPDGLQVRAVRGHDRDGMLVVASTDPTQTHVYRVRWDGTLDQLTDEQGTHDCTVGGSTVLLSSSSLERGLPRSVVGGVEIRCTADEPELVPLPTLARLGERRLATAVLYPTEHVPGTPLPVILDPYGGPHAQRVLARRGAYFVSQWLADQGFAVVVIDGRGTPGRGPAWDREVYRDLASAPLADQVDGLHAAAAEHPDLDLARVGIRGWSFGGYLSLLAVLRRPDVFRAAVAGAPVTEWRLYDTHYTERYLGMPDTDSAAYDRSSVLPDASGLSGRLQLIHGLTDDNVIARHSLLLSHELLLLRKPHDCLLLPGITHMAADPRIYTALLEREVDFFRDALGAPGTRPRG
jgi:dipeptidyl-peptidase 4